MLVIVWCLLSWFPNIRWYEQPFKGLDQVVQPIVGPFRRLIPPISGIDLSPMIAILVIQFVGSVARQVFP
jgi:YggT family protein